MGVCALYALAKCGCNPSFMGREIHYWFPFIDLLFIKFCAAPIVSPLICCRNVCQLRGKISISPMARWIAVRATSLQERERHSRSLLTLKTNENSAIGSTLHNLANNFATERSNVEEMRLKKVFVSKVLELARYWRMQHTALRSTVVYRIHDNFDCDYFLHSLPIYLFTSIFSLIVSSC